MRTHTSSKVLPRQMVASFITVISGLFFMYFLVEVLIPDFTTLEGIQVGLIEPVNFYYVGKLGIAYMLLITCIFSSVSMNRKISPWIKDRLITGCNYFLIICGLVAILYGVTSGQFNSGSDTVISYLIMNLTVLAAAVMYGLVLGLLLEWEN